MPRKRTVTARKSTSKTAQYRSAATGRYVTRASGSSAPRTTVRERKSATRRAIDDARESVGRIRDLRF